MCGIVGYVGKSQAAPILLDGLSKLEYRGYDSAGMAVYDGTKIEYEKAILDNESIDDIFAEVEDIEDIPIISIDSEAEKKEE